MKTLALLLLAVTPYTQEMTEWRARLEASLKRDGGWLTVTGLIWLKPGVNTYGADPKADVVLPKGAPQKGVIELNNGVVTSGGRTLRADGPDRLELGAVSLYVIRRGERTGIRMKDMNSELRRNFTGCKWYPIQESYRVKARFVSAPTPIRIVNVLGQSAEETSPGYASFTLQGQTLRLYSTSSGYLFRDQTSAHETYGAGRFLDADPPKDGYVVLDFNQAYNPPCAFTPFATCPLPPKQNQLPVKIEAGEKNYGKH